MIHNLVQNVIKQRHYKL